MSGGLPMSATATCSGVVVLGGGGGGSRFASHHAHQSCPWCSFKLADMSRTVMLCVNASDPRLSLHMAFQH